MRPQRFQDFAVELASKDPLAGKAVTLKEAGDSTHPFGLAAMLNGAEARFQFIAESAPGDKYSEPETPVEGDPVAPLEGPAAGSGKAGAEAWLGSLLASSGSREIAAIELWSQRPDAKPGHHGVTVRCHSGAKVYARAL